MRSDEEKRVESSYAEGVISILSVIRNRSRTVHEILFLPTVKKDDRNIQRLMTLANREKIPMALSDESFFQTVTTGHTHGGVIARVGERKMLTPREVFSQANGFVFLLCGVEDPFNFGCAVRSFYAAGAGGMLLTPRNWLSAAGVTLRSSAGTSEALPCAVAQDADETLKMAKECGYRVICATEEGATPLYSAPLTGKIFLIVGGEKRGISRTYVDGADVKIKIPYGRDFRSSLTASAAAAVCAFEVLRQKDYQPNQE